MAMPRSAGRGAARARLSVLAAGAALASACTKDAATSAAPTGPAEMVAWGFPSEAAEVRLRLWPAEYAAPGRKKRALTTHDQQGRLSVVVEGADPAFSWDFEKEVEASIVHVEVEAATAGTLQLFWGTRRCPNFSEACSATRRLVPGTNVVSFLLDERDPLRSLRLDPPDSRGAQLWFNAIDLRSGAGIDDAWSARETVTALEQGPSGLRLVAALPDPGMTISTPGLDAGRVTAVELVLRSSTGSPGPGRPASPQLFWDGPCAFFSEECSVRLLPADAGALTHRAILKRHAKWTGRIGALRLDPGPDAGEYVFERIALVRDPAD